MPPRLRNLLAMLARESGPLPVREVADRLRVSRRTVFRELANVDAVLGPYGLRVGSRAGEGVILDGPEQARTSFLRDLGKLEQTGPADRQDRQDKLVLAIIQTPEQKLATYADRLGVSAPTISHDLDDIEPILVEYGLRLGRRPGTGITIDGPEIAIRRIILTLMARTEEPSPYPHPDILLDIQDLAGDLDPLLGWMTPHSRERFHHYLTVLVQRILDGKALSSGSIHEHYSRFRSDADRLATILTEAFNIQVSSEERLALMVELAGARPNIPRDHSGRDEEELVVLASDMIERFDPSRAPLLKLDDVLLGGLVAHLRTAIVRIRHRIQATDPMRSEIAATYPDILERCRTACQALRSYGEWLPEEEVSLLAAHFGAALLRLSEQGARRRTVRVGVICVHGIGSSYLLASQVKGAFSNRVLVEVGWHGDRETWDRYDILVSTTPLEYDASPVVVVPAILTDSDLERLDEALSRLQTGAASQEKAPADFVGNIKSLEDMARQVRLLVERFTVQPVSDTVAFPELAAAAGRLFAPDQKTADGIARDLMARERVSSQVIPELGLVLLHCRTAGTGTPLFGLVQPAGKCFTDSYLKAAKMAVVMLLPLAAPREAAELMGCLSSALIEDKRFYDAVATGRASAVGDGIRRILGAALFQFSMQILKG